MRRRPVRKSKRTKTKAKSKSKSKYVHAPRLLIARRKSSFRLDPLHYDIIRDAALVEGVSTMRVLDMMLNEWFNKHTPRAWEDDRHEL